MLGMIIMEGRHMATRPLTLGYNSPNIQAAHHQIRLTIVHLSTSSKFHFFPLPFLTSASFSFSSAGKVRVLETVGEPYGRSSSSFDRYSLVCLLYSYLSASFGWRVLTASSFLSPTADLPKSFTTSSASLSFIPACRRAE
jgi:hypothetical protein